MTWDQRYQNEMLRRLRRRLGRLGVPEHESAMRKINPEIERAIATYSYMIVDERTRPHLRLAAGVLASYHVVASGPLHPQQALELVEEVFTSIGRTMMRIYTQALLTITRDPFLALTRAATKRALAQYGKAWDFRIEETDRHFTMTATKCFYNDFFQAAAAPQLTRVFCSWDRNWIGSVIPDRHKMSFERPTTLGYGGKECPFIFRRIATDA